MKNTFRIRLKFLANNRCKYEHVTQSKRKHFLKFQAKTFCIMPQVFSLCYFSSECFNCLDRKQSLKEINQGRN